MLMHKFFGNPYDVTVANFFVSAYQELGLMCIDGRSLMIAYSDLHTANISTLKDPTGHLPGRRVPCVISNAEGVFLGQLPRSIFDACCDHMLADFELQCAMAKHPSWKIIAALISRYLNGFFKLHGNLEMDVVRDKFMIRIDLMWRDICKATAGAGCLPPADMRSPEAAVSAAASQHYAVLSVSHSTSLFEKLRLSCGHFFDDLREERSVCQKHYADVCQEQFELQTTLNDS
jgi:hypothetical protein